jgi:hypothetical protein
MLWICLLLAPIGLIPDFPYSLLAGDEHMNLCSAQLHFSGMWCIALLNTHCCDLLKSCSILGPPPPPCFLNTFFLLFCLCGSAMGSSVCTIFPLTFWKNVFSLLCSKSIICLFCLAPSWSFCFSLACSQSCDPFSCHHILPLHFACSLLYYTELGGSVFLQNSKFDQTMWCRTSEHGTLYILLFHHTLLWEHAFWKLKWLFETDALILESQYV